MIHSRAKPVKTSAEAKEEILENEQATNSMSIILEKLKESEQAMCVAEKEAGARIREAEAKVSEASEQILEMRRTQEQEVRVMKAQNEKKIRDTSYAQRCLVLKAQKESATTRALAEAAEFHQKRAETHVSNLEQKIKDLQAMIQKRGEHSDLECSHVQRIMDGRYARVSEQADDRIRSMAEHAKEVCTATGAAWQTMGSELQDQMLRASVRAEGRVRFKELRTLAKAFDKIDLTKDTYDGLKGNLIELWHLQSKAPNESKFSIGAKSAQSPRSASAMSPMPTMPMSPEGGRRSSATNGHPMSPDNDYGYDKGTDNYEHKVIFGNSGGLLQRKEERMASRGSVSSDGGMQAAKRASLQSSNLPNIS